VGVGVTLVRFVIVASPGSYRDCAWLILRWLTAECVIVFGHGINAVVNATMFSFVKPPEVEPLLMKTILRLGNVVACGWEKRGSAG
jgi:hypothetical protein